MIFFNIYWSVKSNDGSGWSFLNHWIVGFGVPTAGQANVIDLPSFAWTIVSFSAPSIQGGTSQQQQKMYWEKGEYLNIYC